MNETQNGRITQLGKCRSQSRQPVLIVTVDTRVFAQKTEAHLTIECERAVEEERVRADDIEEQRTVAELQNELLTEMVAAEQVNVGTPQPTAQNSLSARRKRKRLRRHDC